MGRWLSGSRPGGELSLWRVAYWGVVLVGVVLEWNFPGGELS